MITSVGANKNVVSLLNRFIFAVEPMGKEGRFTRLYRTLRDLTLLYAALCGFTLVADFGNAVGQLHRFAKHVQPALGGVGPGVRA